jgi:hypothetical protein
MSRLVVLGSGEQARHWSRLLQGQALAAQGLTGNCDALLVVNDRSAESVDSLRQALQLRRARPGLQVAVLNLLEPQSADTPSLARMLGAADPSGDLRVSTDQATALFGNTLNSVQIRFDDDILSFEYGCDNDDADYDPAVDLAVAHDLK